MRAAPLLAAALLAALPARAAELTLRRVVLSAAGVGYFEYEGQTGGDTPLGWDVPLDQVDDVLKSLVVFGDPGAAGTVELPGRDNAHAVFGGVPFGPAGLASPLAFLNGLQGVEVMVAGPRPMTGRILRAETVRDPAPPDRPAPSRTRVSVLTADGLKQFVLEDADGVQIADPALRARVADALAATRGEAGQEVRRITLANTAAGPHAVRIGFVAAAPVWKASYRLILPPADAAPDAARARLQGWATLENTTRSDWSGVALSVQYGNPVTFRQAIYRSYFVTRPEVPVSVLSPLLPDVDTRARAAVPPPPPPAPAAAAPVQQFALKAEPPSPVMASPAEAAAVQEGAEETVFTLPTPISLAAGHSASVPILDVQVPAVRVSLLTQDDPRAVAALRVTNTTASSLPAGVLTLYDPAADAPYAGDARLGGLPAGESRLIGFAQDLRMAVEWRHEDAVTVAALSAAGGVLTVDQRHRQVTHATLTAPANAPRHVLLEVPKAGGATVAPGFAQPAEQTAAAWRFAAILRPGETREITYAIDGHEQQTVALLDDDDDALAAVLTTAGISDAARSALRRVTDLRRAQADRTAERDRIGTQRTAVETDEARLRANLGALQPGDALRTRLLNQLAADETRHGQLDTAYETADAAVTAAHDRLVGAVMGLQF